MQSSAESAVSKKDAAASTATEKDLTDRQRYLQFWLGDTQETLDKLDEILADLLPRLLSDSEAHFGIRTLRLIYGDVRDRLQPQIQKIGEDKEIGQSHASQLLHAALSPTTGRNSSEHHGPYHVLEALRALHVYISHIEGCLTALTPVSQAMWNKEFFEAVKFATEQIGRMQQWVKHQMQVRAPQTLLVPSLQKMEFGEDTD